MKTNQIWILLAVILILSTITVFTQTDEKGAKQTKNTTEAIIDGTDVVLRVTAYKNNAVAASEFFKPDGGNKFVSVQVIMDNSKGTEDWNVKPENLKLKDSEGNVYERYEVETTSPSLKSVIADSGDIVKGWVTFQVGNAVDIKSLKLRYEESSETKSGWIELKNVK